MITFIDRSDARPERILIQVKSGHVNVGDVRDLRGTVEREGAAMGVFITLEEPTRPMKDEAIQAGFYRPKAWEGQYPRIQILTIADLLAGKRVEMPAQRSAFKQAERVQDEGPRTMEMFGEE